MGDIEASISIIASSYCTRFHTDWG
jgi:hypothetical protein